LRLLGLPAASNLGREVEQSGASHAAFQRLRLLQAKIDVVYTKWEADKDR
jgi:hypothetical protein